MNYLYVYRNNYQDENSLFQMISDLHSRTDSVYGAGLGINYLSVDSIFKGFKMIMRQSFKYSVVKYHLLELRMQEPMAVETAIELCRRFSYLLFYKLGFAHYVTIIKEGGALRCIYLVAPISIKSWQGFSNCNRDYIWLLNWLKENAGADWEFGSGAVLFKSEEPYLDNYKDIVL